MEASYEYCYEEYRFSSGTGAKEQLLNRTTVQPKVSTRVNDINKRILNNHASNLINPTNKQRELPSLSERRIGDTKNKIVIFSKL